MCVIAFGRVRDLNFDDLNLCNERNPAGIGFAWKDNSLKFMRGVSFDEMRFLISHMSSNTKICIHFRRSEKREPKSYLTHPFPIDRTLTEMSGDNKLLFFHNGTLTIKELKHLAKVVKYSPAQLERDLESFAHNLTSNTEIFSRIIAGRHPDTIDFAINSILAAGNKSRIALWSPNDDEPVFYNKHKFFKRGNMLYSNYRSVKREQVQREPEPIEIESQEEIKPVLQTPKLTFSFSSFQ